LAAHITGTDICPFISLPKLCIAAGSPSQALPSAKALRSMPAQNDFSPVPVRTMARMDGSFSACSMAPPMPTMTSPSSAFRTSGRFIPSTNVVPRRSWITFSAIGMSSRFGHSGRFGLS
jgi:hypothetical protein